MTSIPFNKLVIGMGLWLVLGFLTALSAQSASGLDDIENVLNSSVQPQQVNISDLNTSGSGGSLEAAKAAVEVSTTGADNLLFIFKSMTLQGPMWEDDWSSPIRAILWAVMAVFGLYIAYEGLRLLQGFIPFT